MKPEIEILKSLWLPDFPSGSSITYYEGKLYIIGDDANTVLILDSGYQRVEEVAVFNYPDERIPKTIKSDLETSTLLNIEGVDYLFVLGSASRVNRMQVILISLNGNSKIHEHHTIDLSEFVNRLQATIGEINIEGSAVVKSNFILSNRANFSNPVNHLLLTGCNFFNEQSTVSIKAIALILPSKNNNDIIGVSELCYINSNDIMLLSLSTELTSNAYDDGVIGDSYLGWITNFSQRIATANIELDGVVNLVECNASFNGEKIEGLCVECIEEEQWILHLVSDDDKGSTKVFKIQLHSSFFTTSRK